MADTGIGKGEILLGFIIVLALIVGFTSIMLEGLNEFSESDACTDATGNNGTCIFGNPAGFCAINGTTEGSGIACTGDVRESLPLGTLFSIVLGVIFAVGVFMFAVKSLKKMG